MDQTFSKDFNEIDGALLQAYSDASGDTNEIHLTDEAAKSAGLEGRIAHGMLLASWITTTVSEGVGAAWVIKEQSYRFKAMTRLGESVSVQAELVSADDEMIQVKARAIGRDDEVKVIATLELRPVQ